MKHAPAKREKLPLASPDAALMLDLHIGEGTFQRVPVAADLPGAQAAKPRKILSPPPAPASPLEGQSHARRQYIGVVGVPPRVHAVEDLGRSKAVFGANRHVSPSSSSVPRYR